jgi:hypothetical protein
VGYVLDGQAGWCVGFGHGVSPVVIRSGATSVAYELVGAVVTFYVQMPPELGALRGDIAGAWPPQLGGILVPACHLGPERC